MQSIFNRLGFPIRKSADQFIFADPRGLSQLITSFIASESQGIPRVPFLTFFYYTAFCSVCMLFDSCCVFRFIRSLVHSFIGIATDLLLFRFTRNPSEPQQSSILLSSLSIYFFQYVKERGPKPLKGLLHYIPPPLGGRGAWWRITDSNR